MPDLVKFQPVLPPEEPPTQAEKHFIELQPPIFPPNQDSNFGLKRKNFTDQLQLLIEQQALMWAERFVQRSTMFLDEWEFTAGIPENPTGVSVAERRLRVQARITSGPFTDQRRIVIVEPYVLATFGISPEFTPAGLDLFGGIPLYADASGDPKQFYRIYEDVRNFAYTLYIRSDMTPDIPTMTRDLERITPAGITVTIDNSLAVILHYFRQIRTDQPAGYWRLLDTAGTDSSGNGLGGTWAGSPATVASPGLLHASVASSDGAITLDGVDDYMTVATDYRLHTPKISLEAWYKPNALPSSGTKDIIMAESANDYIGIDGTTGNFIASASVGSVAKIVQAAPAVVGTTYHLASRFTGSEIQLFVNNVKYSAPAGGFRDIGNTGIYIGRAQGGGSFASGVVDEVALYDRELTDSEIKLHYDTGRNVAI
jgi:hypothetical protein